MIEISSDEDASSLLSRGKTSNTTLSYESDSDTAPDCRISGRYNTAFTARKAVELSL